MLVDFETLPADVRDRSEPVSLNASMVVLVEPAAENEDRFAGPVQATPPESGAYADVPGGFRPMKPNARPPCAIVWVAGASHGGTPRPVRVRGEVREVADKIRQARLWANMPISAPGRPL